LIRLAAYLICLNFVDMLYMEDTKFQKLDLSGLKTLVHWAKMEGWNPGPYDADIFYNTDPDGFYGYFYEGNLIAGGAIVSYNSQFGFMGLFIVKPEFRSEGLGRKLWFKRRDLLIERLQSNASIGMDGVIAMQPFYKKGGFEIAFKDHRYEKLGIPLDMDANISPITNEDFDAILAYDESCFGFSRPQFLKPWLHLPENYTFKYTEHGILKGFAVLRKANEGFKIGPLFANNGAIAEALYRACLNAVVGELVYLDIPMNNPEAITLIKKYDAKYVFECARMYYGKTPKSDLHKVFGITTFELG
jgi:GNAT superfamily N-acetyltransferase